MWRAKDFHTFEKKAMKMIIIYTFRTKYNWWNYYDMVSYFMADPTQTIPGF